MTEEVGDVAKLVMNHLSDADIDKLPKDVKEILHIKRDNSSDDNSMWISLFGGMCWKEFLPYGILKHIVEK